MEGREPESTLPSRQRETAEAARAEQHPTRAGELQPGSDLVICPLVPLRQAQHEEGMSGQVCSDWVQTGYKAAEEQAVHRGKRLADLCRHVILIHQYSHNIHGVSESTCFLTDVAQLGI